MVSIRWILLSGCIALGACTQGLDQAEVVFKGADPTAGPASGPADLTPPPQPAPVETQVQTANLPPLQPQAAPAGQGLDQPRQSQEEYAQYEPDRYHTVAPGETVYSIARSYQTTPSAIRLANRLNENYAIQPGQTLTIPPGRAPLPPSAGDPAPAAPVQARELQSPQLGQYRSDVASRRLMRPVPGDIVAGFGDSSAAGPRTGVELRALPGIPVKAADDGEVVFVSSDDSPLGQMLLLKHEGGLMSVYGNLRNVAVSTGAVIGRGTTLAEVAEPPRGREPTVRFELRRGATPIDPTPFL